MFGQSINKPYDAIPPGQTNANMLPDTRGPNWGLCGVQDVLVQILNVPPGMRARLLSWRGDFYGYIVGSAPPGTHAGILAGIITQTKPGGAGPGVIQQFWPTQNPDGSYDWTAKLCANTAAPNIDPQLQAQDGCCLFVCDALAAEMSKTRVSIWHDFTGDPNAILDKNNTFVMRQATFLNLTGMPLHMELTGIFLYDYVKATS